MSDALREPEIRAQLHTLRYGRSLELRAETGSTNDDARAAAAAGAPDGHTIVAERQRAGRGSKGRTWLSPGGDDLYLSIVDRPAVALHELPPLTLAVGLGVAEAVERCLRELSGTAQEAAHCEVKWPNDVWLGGLKTAGILIEANSRGAALDAVVIGIGLNVNRREMAPEIAARATSLALAGGRTLDRAAVLGILLAAVEGWVDRFASEGAGVVVQALLPRLALRGQRVRCDGTAGLLLDVTPEGVLRIQTDEGPKELISGTLEPWTA